MTIAVWANNEQWNEIISLSADVEWVRMESANTFISGTAATFILEHQGNSFDPGTYTNPVFIHAVDITLQEINPLANLIRINGWTNFLKSSHWEIAGAITEEVKAVLHALNKQFTIVPDVPGLVSARIIAMIINEAYFTLGEGVSSKNDIDIAMKLGTNYPYGPFEWSTMIGVKNIHALLKKLSVAEKRYLPAPLLEKEAAV